MKEQSQYGITLGASPSLQKAVIIESAKPEYDLVRDDELLVTSKAAAAVKRKTPEVFDMGNPADQLIWTLLGDE